MHNIFPLLPPHCDLTATSLRPHCDHTATTLRPHCDHTATTLQPKWLAAAIGAEQASPYTTK